jgi:nitrate/TMAO reductase-like tetraheme cytochrome c subunit
MKIPKSIYNWLSITGIILVLNSLLLMMIILIFSFLSRDTNTYLGVFLWIVLPGFLVLGLILIPIGILISFRKKYEYIDPTLRWPILNMNIRKQRNGVIKISVITFFLLMVSAVGSYQAFHYTESVEFCGQLCHKVMNPEFTTYLHSPHARVTCVECHVGQGASWYVKSKISGLYQVYSVLFNKYPTPIETPIANLRPARETCEHCHWPQKFYSRQLRIQQGYLTSKANTEWNISMVMKIGPEQSAHGLSEGIHWHINNNFKIEYVASTKDRESIPWVRYTNLKTGEVRIFEDEENKLDKKAIDTLKVRTMDCMDCHNRPSHLYRSAPFYVDQAMVAGDVPKDIPYIKKAAMEALKNPYNTEDSAMMGIKQTILGFYSDSLKDILTSRKKDIDKAIAAIQEAYSKNAFPSMKVDASAYLNHIGHLESDGCFRCHSDRHKSPDGKVISKDCDLCHTIVAQGPTGSMTYAPYDKSLTFQHPIDVKDNWKTYFCTECHRKLFE